MKRKLISIVIPCYNESNNVDNFYKELTKTIKLLNYDFEIIFVNDGSKDSTWAKLKKLQSRGNSTVRAISFSRNFGHPAALQAGLESSTGDAIVMLDADLQHPPALIPGLINKWEEGYEIVKTIRTQTEGVSYFKRLTSSVFYLLINTFSDLKLRDGEADFRLVDRKVLDMINQMPETPKFYRGLFNWIGFKSTEIEYRAGSRTQGKSSFTVKKMVELARLGLTSFSMLPLKIIISIGVTLSVATFFALVVMTYVKLFISYTYFSNNAILLTVIIFITGILSTFQGIIAVYTVDIFNAAKGRPAYIVTEKSNIDEKK